MRGREFGMKDMYSFHTTQEDFDRFYQTAKEAYLRVYARLGLTAKVTEASGGSFSEKISYEFMVLTEAGEDTILYCEKCDYCANVEVAGNLKVGDTCPRCGKSTLKQAVASEVGNVFDLGQRYPKALNFTYKDENGKDQYPIMGCYGIGTTRLMGVLVETFADEKGMVWPKAVSPFAVHLVELSGGDAGVKAEADALYKELQSGGIEVLYDDRDARAGEKFSDAELIGIPTRVVISAKTIAEGKLEVVDRKTGDKQMKTKEEVMAL
jgi:prolyl-tRNA synthetase